MTSATTPDARGDLERGRPIARLACAAALAALAGCGSRSPAVADGGDGGASPDGGSGARAQLTTRRCVDLAGPGGGEPIITIEISGGQPGGNADVLASRSACGVAPFVHRTVPLNGSGGGRYQVEHPGPHTCDLSLLGSWDVQVVTGGEALPPFEVTFFDTDCAAVDTCEVAAARCPSGVDGGDGGDAEPGDAGDAGPRDGGPGLDAGSGADGGRPNPAGLFVLTAQERAAFDPAAFVGPDGGVNWGNNYEDYPLKNLWQAFDRGLPVVATNEQAGETAWFKEGGGGSQNHALLWMGVSALGHALSGDVARYEVAAIKCRRLLELDRLEGHQRYEALGYTGFWEGGIATMALAGFYAPAGAPSGPPLLAEARRWWSDHLALLRAISMPDGQVVTVGARLGGAAGEPDAFGALSAALNLQLLDPRTHSTLHPTLQTLLTSDGRPGGRVPNISVRWDVPRHVAQRWVVLRASQRGALVPLAANAPLPRIVQRIYRWNAGGRTHVATPRVIGYYPARFSMSWAAGQYVRIENSDTTSTGGRGLPDGHLPLVPLTIPSSAQFIAGP